MTASTATPPGLSVLAVDDDAAVLHSVGRLLRQAGYRFDLAEGGAAALERLRQQPYDLLLVDLGMPEIDGFEVMKQALQSARARNVIVITGSSSVPVAVEAMRSGAKDFVTKPFDPATLLKAVQRCAAHDVADTQTPDDEDFTAWRQKYAPDIIGDHPRLVDLLELVRRVSDTDCSVLITGKSGTGKELIAQALHRASPRAKRPFVAVNCAAIPKDLMESEIFGHAKGAFTGATERREGKFQVADGGTMFLDEIGEMDLVLQGKFLRVIQEKEFTPIGESRAQKADVRIIAATNRDLEERARNGQFREDLFYRLNVIPIELPALNERIADVPMLAAHFVERANRRHSRKVTGIEPGALLRLAAYPWPGNIRELHNLLERLVILKGKGELREADLPPAFAKRDATPDDDDAAQAEAHASAEGGVDLTMALERLERRLTVDALRRAQGNKAKAAQMLGLKRTTLIERLKKLAIPDDM